MDRRALFNRIRKISSTFFFLALLLTPFSLLLSPAPAHASTSTTVYGPSTLYTGMVGWWTMDGKNTNWATGVTNDSSGNGDGGQLVNMSTTTSPAEGRVGQALYFNGTSQGINFGKPSVLNFTSSFTVSEWIDLQNANSGIACIMVIGYCNTTSTREQIFMYVDSNGPMGALFAVHDSVGDKRINTPSNTYAINTWHLMTGTFDNSSSVLSFYIDGALIGTTTAVGPLNSNVTSGDNYGIGYNPGGNNDFFTGLIDDTRFYNRALSASEIKELYQTGRSQQGVSPVGPGNLNSGLVGWWTMDGKDTNWSTGVTSDSSGNGNNGQMSGMSTTTSIVEGKIGQALYFNGSNTSIYASSFANIKNDFTTSLWYKLDPSILQTTANYGLVDGGQNGTLRNFAFRIEMSSGVEKFLVTKYGIVDMTIGSLTPDTRWHNAVLVFSSTNGTTVYQDGVQVGNDTGTTNLANNYSGFVIGKSLDTTPVYFNGAIDDVRSYHRVLSAAEIGQLYHAGHNQQSVSQVGPANLNSGLVGWWTFDGKNTNWGTGVTNDSSGNGNSGHLIGMSTTTSITEGKIGQALMFPGTGSSYVTKTSFSGDTSKGGSASFWVKLKSYVDFGAALVSNNIGVDIYFRSSPAIQLTNRDSNGNTVASIFDTTNIPPLNRWSLVTVTWDSSATKYYLNGALIDTSAGTTTYQTLNGDTIYIGNDRNSSGRTINGSLDDVRIYNRALSAQEVQQLYNSTR